jgi:hypothetical protein
VTSFVNRQAKWKAANKDKVRQYTKKYYDMNRDKEIVRATDWRLANPERSMLGRAKNRATRLGIEFNLDISDIVIPDKCPILGIELASKRMSGPCASSPSLDRIDSSKGYIKGNVWVISHKANSMKSNANIEEMLAFAEWAKRTYAT